jgi:hypothetical protein
MICVIIDPKTGNAVIHIQRIVAHIQIMARGSQNRELYRIHRLRQGVDAASAGV